MTSKTFNLFPKKPLDKRTVNKIVNELGTPADFCFDHIDDGAGCAVDIHRIMEYARLAKLAKKIIKS